MTNGDGVTDMSLCCNTCAKDFFANDALLGTRPPTLKILCSPPRLIAVRRWVIGALKESKAKPQPSPLAIVSRRMNLASEVGLTALAPGGVSVGGITQPRKMCVACLSLFALIRPELNRIMGLRFISSTYSAMLSIIALGYVTEHFWGADVGKLALEGGRDNQT